MATYMQSGTTPYFTEEQISELRTQQRKVAKRRLACGLVASILAIIAGISVCVYYIVTYFQLRGHEYSDGFFTYRYNDSYFVLRAAIGGAVAGIFLIVAVTVIVNYKNTMRRLNGPSTSWLQVVQAGNTYNANTTHVVTKPEYQNQQYAPPNHPPPAQMRMPSA